MMKLDKEPYEYRVGGSLPEHAPSYVIRQADQDFYSGLKSGDFCYVFNSRQMGKTSLLVRTLHQLRSEGIACTSIDVSGRGSGDIKPEQWYAGIVYTLVKDFQLANPLQFMKSWWQEREFLDPAQRLAEMIETILLPNTTTQIIIFIDEIDSTLSLNFSTDDFFALIRSCYDKRANNADYTRLTFALIGVARPTDLIADKRRTPFNIGRAIELSGFTTKEAAPLATGLQGNADQPEKVLEKILYWTNGQPFLTQKLCYILSTSGLFISGGKEEMMIAELVWAKAIKDWESKDNPPHFKTISTRITANETSSGSLLGLYQQILNQTMITIADRPEERELQLAGIVINFGNELKVANPIYAAIFDRSWVDKQLDNLRPYGIAANEWLESNKKDESRLLRGKALEEALSWSKGKNLSSLDSQFLSACREQRIHEENQDILQQRIKQLWLLSVLASLFAISALFFAFQARSEKEKSQIAAINAKNALNQALIKSATSKHSLETLIGTLEAADLFQKQKQFFNEDEQKELQRATEVNLQYAINGTLERNRLGHCNTVTGANYSPDGKFIASVSQDKMLKIWQVDGKLIKQIPHNSALNDLAISADSQKIFTVGKSKQVLGWNTQGEALLPILKPYKNKEQFNRIAITPDSKYIAAATDGSPGSAEIVIWSIASGEIVKVLKFPKSTVNLLDRTYSFRDLKFSSDGRFLAGASTDNTVKVWQWETSKDAQILAGHQDWAYSLSFSADNKWLVSSGGGSDKSMKFWEIQETGFKLRKTIEKVYEDGFYVAFNPVNGQLATVSSSLGSTIRIWDVDQIVAHPKSVLTNNDWSGILLANIGTSRSEHKSIAYSPDGKRIILAGADFKVTIWEPDRSLKKNISASEFSIQRVVYSRSGKYIATGGADKMVKIWQADGTLLHTLAGHQDWVYGLSFSPDDQFIASASEDNTVKIWRVVDGSLVRTLKHDQFAYDVSFSPDGHYLASVGNDGKLRVWDANSDQQFAEFSITNNDHWVWKTSFSPDGKYLANTTSEGVEIRRTTDFMKIRTLNNKGKGVKTIHSINFSHDSKMIAAAGVDGAANIWQIQDGKSVTKYEAHIGNSDDIRFSVDDQEVATTGDDGTVKFWGLDGKLLRTLEGSVGLSLAFSPDGKTFVTVNKSGVMKFWDLAKLERKYLSMKQSYQKGGALLQEYSNQSQEPSSTECKNPG
jgi:WD40 repeat protein